MRCILGTTVALLVVFVCPVASGMTWHVDASVSESGNGHSSHTAFRTIQEGIDAASDDDTVLVAEGTYVENIHFKGKNIILTSTDPIDSTIVELTIIDGGRAASAVGFSGVEEEICLLAGFTITGGGAEYGGGICGGSRGLPTHATVRNNLITGNHATRWGGGLASCDGIIEQNDIVANSAVGADASGGGGLAYCDGTIRANKIRGNVAENANPALPSCDGGGLYSCNGSILNNIITGNSSDRWGGGLANCADVIQNNLISGNSAGGRGAGLFQCSGTIQNNTITANSAGDFGGGLYGCYGVIRNCIIWGNVSTEGPQIYISSKPCFSYIEGWSQGGEGNIAENPIFIDPAGGNYHLQSGSPCIDSGLDYYWCVWPQRDPDGNCRRAGQAVDVGCFEYGAAPDSDGDLLSDADEVAAGSDPNREDSDGDGLRDGLEILRGSDPLLATQPGAVHVLASRFRIQRALCLALDGDEVIVSHGLYSENLRFCGADVILRSVEPRGREVVTSTILDGHGAGPVVSFAGNESPACVLSGFTIRNGNGDGISVGTHGLQTGATIENNVVTRNTGTWAYGIRGCDGIVQNNTISDNSWCGLGGCGGLIQNNTISGNSGGGLADCDGIIRNNIITGNSTEKDGGGLSGCDGIIQNNIITDNSAIGEFSCGGGLSDCDGVIENNMISGNYAMGSGGGLHFCEAVIQNNVITRNHAPDGGGLALLRSGAILNNTICYNVGEYGGGTSDCNCVIRNCIIWGNTATEGAQVFWSSEPIYSCVQDWTEGGEGNIMDDPRFVDAGGLDDDPDTIGDNDYHLRPDSPCIDAGDNAAVGSGRLDKDGNLRIAFGRTSLTVDMGAYEYNSRPFTISHVVRGDGVQLFWNSQPSDDYIVWSCPDPSLPNWTEEAAVPSEGTVSWWTDSLATSGFKFYRIEMK